MSKTIKNEDKLSKPEAKTIRLDKNQTIQLYQNKEREIEGLSQRIEQVDGILIEMEKAESSLKEIEKIKDTKKMLVNVGAGIMVECDISNKALIKVMLPGQIMTDKAITEVLEDITLRKTELEKARNQLMQSYNQTTHMLDQLSKAFRELQLKETEKKKEI